jgi:hypothetical protein
MWLRVVVVFATHGWGILAHNELCNERLSPAVLWALGISLVELITSAFGVTRSRPMQVLLFASVRSGTELLVTPLITCRAWQHLFTVLCWSTGEVVRFGCFAFDGINPRARFAKSIRYSLGPILFPLGAAGEMLMVIRAASYGRPWLYLAASLWPLGFYPLMKQLLKQCRKHFYKTRNEEPELKKL